MSGRVFRSSGAKNIKQNLFYNITLYGGMR
jgi:hypothetical protein